MRAGRRPLEDRQRQPGDYDAQVRQRPIEVHELEHLAATDKGIIMLRNMVRRGIRAAQDGQDPLGGSREEPHAAPIYAHDRLVDVPPAPTKEEDKRLVRETGRRVAEEFIKNPALR